MTCKHTTRLLSRQLDGRASGAERAQIEAHLPGCAGCRAELARLEVPARALRAIGPASVPEDLAGRSWRAAIAARQPPSFADGFVWAAQRAAAAGAVAAALVWGGFLLGDSGPGAGGSAELVAAPDAAEMAVSLWSAVEPGSFPDE